MAVRAQQHEPHRVNEIHFTCGLSWASGARVRACDCDCDWNQKMLRLPSEAELVLSGSHLFFGDILRLSLGEKWLNDFSSRPDRDSRVKMGTCRSKDQHAIRSRRDH